MTAHAENAGKRFEGLQHAFTVIEKFGSDHPVKHLYEHLAATRR